MGPTPQVQPGGKPAHHPDGGSVLICAFGQHSQKENTQQGPIGHRNDLEPDLYDAPYLMQCQERQPKQHQRPHHIRQPRELQPFLFVRYGPESEVEIKHRARGK